MNKILIISGIILLGIAAYGKNELDDVPAKLPVPVVGVARVTEVDDMNSRRYTGQVVSQALVNITPRISGEILEMGFKEGAAVKTGQILYRLDPTQYEATVKNVEAKIAEWKAKIEYAKSNYNRQFSLFEKDAVSRDTMESSKSELKAYEAGLLASEADLITARDNLKNTTITAPIAGVAGVTAYTVGNYITPNSGVLLTIIQVQPIRVRFSISTADYQTMFDSPMDMQANGLVTVKLSSGITYPVEGKIEFLNNQANSKTDAIQVFATFPNSDFKLIVGSTVSVTLSRKSGKRTAAVRPSALLHDSNGVYVYVLKTDNTVEKRIVTEGNATASLQMIESGLKPGETVIVKGTNKVTPGSKAEPIFEE
mgnify:CR=1 FL=1